VSSYFPSDFCILILLLRSLSHELHPNFSFFGILQPYMRGRAWLQVTSGKASPAFSNFIFPFLHLLGLALCPLLLAVFNDRSCFLPRSIILLALLFFFYSFGNFGCITYARIVLILRPAANLPGHHRLVKRRTGLRFNMCNFGIITNSCYGCLFFQNLNLILFLDQMLQLPFHSRAVAHLLLVQPTFLSYQDHNN